jgi:methylated-DNA-[protein]-cysteine S-methyltransferase
MNGGSMPTRTEPLLHTTIESPIGDLLLLGDGDALRGVYMQAGRKPVRVADAWQAADEPFAQARSQLEQYFAGERTSFDLPLAAEGSEFERRVWRALEDIPFGETQSYGEVAERIGAPGAARAVGLANGRNPISIVVPCHRVIGANGTLTGYGGGLERKRFLLELEQGTLRLA